MVSALPLYTDCRPKQSFDVLGASEYTVALNMVRNCIYYCEIQSISIQKILFLTILEATVYSRPQKRQMPVARGLCYVAKK